MAYYLVTATPRQEKLPALERELASDAYLGMRPFGHSLTMALKGARDAGDGKAVWEEEDYCRPPLAEERAAVLDDYFDDISVEPVSEGEGWRRIDALPRLFPGLDAA